MIKLYAHRGFVTKTGAENSLASLDCAYENKFFGVEFDVWFLNDELIISHDNPAQNKNLAKFSDFLRYKNEIEYWIDFKNLDAANANKACKLLKHDLENAKINLKKVYFAPFIENLEIAAPVYRAIENHFQSPQIMAVCCQIDKKDFSAYYEKLRKNHIKFLSIQHENITQEFVDIFKETECFAWTVNDINRLRQLEKLGIKRMTSDNLTPKNL